MSVWRKLYLPEIHDLYPGMSPGADALAAEFPEGARERIAWSVVPNWQNRAHIAEADGYGEGLKRLPGTIVQHGWTHSLGADLLNWLFYGHDNRSEFRSLGRAEAEDRVAKGQQAFRAALGHAPRWFCAPRWQLSGPAEEALRAAGFHGHLAQGEIARYGADPVPMPALNFDEGERAPVRALAKPRRARLIRDLLAAERPFRLVLHPDDLRFAGVRAQVRETVAALRSEGWRPVGLDEALALWQEHAA